MTSVTTDRRRGVDTSAAVKVPVRYASTGNLSSLAGTTQTVDGQTASSGRILVWNQTSVAENGIYDIGSTWTRSLDFDSSNEIQTGTLVYVSSGGSAYGNRFFVVSSTAPKPGSTNMAFVLVQLPLAGAGAFGTTLVSAVTSASALSMLGLSSDLTDTPLRLAGGGTSSTSAAGARSALSAMGSAYMRVFSTSATWTKPTGLIGALVEVQGSGGGGGSAIGITGGAGGGGGGGGYARAFFASSTLPSTVAVIVGTGGIAGTTSTASLTGSSGSSSEFGTFVSAVGGLGGQGTSQATPGAGGSAGDGQVDSTAAAQGVTFIGSPGVHGSSMNTIGVNGLGGHGGIGFFIGAGRGGLQGAGSPGVRGGGGGGGASTAIGGAGGNGLVVVWEFTATAT